MANWLAGLVGGAIAGVVMLGAIMTIAPYRGYGEFFTPVRLVARVVQGPAAARGGVNTLVVGTGLLVGISAIYGLLFALIMQLFGFISLGVMARMGILLGSGIIYGNIIFGFHRFFLVPLLDWPMARRLPFIDFAAVHLIFGVVLAWFVALMA